jgi:hypothetical protein
MINHGLFGNRDVKPAAEDGLLASIMRVINGNPEMKRILDEDERLVTQADRRVAIVEELRELKASSERRLQVLATKEAAALKELQAIEPRYEAIAVAWRNAKHALDADRYETRISEGRLLDELTENADPIIDQTLATVQQLWGDYHFNRAKYGVSSSLENRLIGDRRQETIIKTNGPSLDRWRNAVLAALRDLPSLKRDPDQSNIPERCAAILAGIPDWTEVVEVKI